MKRKSVKKSKTYLSAANIIGGRKSSLNNFPDNSRLSNSKKKSSAARKNVANLTMPMSHLAVKRLDYRVLTLNIQRARGFLMRKSMRIDRKWTSCFYLV